MAYYNIAEFALEDALVTYFTTPLKSVVPITRGSEYNEVRYPVAYVQIVSATEPPELEGTATVEVVVDVGVVTNIATPTSTHSALVGAVMDLIFSGGFLPAVNLIATSLVVQRVRREARTTDLDVARDTRTTAQRLNMLCSMNK